MKKQRFIHIAEVVFQITGALIAWHYLPPWLALNPGVLILLTGFILTSVAHFILHDK